MGRRAYTLLRLNREEEQQVEQLIKLYHIEGLAKTAQIRYLLNLLHKEKILL